MNWQHFTFNDGISLVCGLLCVMLLCILIIKIKRLGRPDERSTAIVAYMFASIFIALLVSFPLAGFVLPAGEMYRVLGPLALSLLAGVFAEKVYKKINT